MLLPGVWLWAAVRRFGCIFMKNNALMAGQQVTPGKGSSTLTDKGLLLGVCSGACKHQSIDSITRIHAWR